jgi:hypothetical protein
MHSPGDVITCLTLVQQCMHACMHERRLKFAGVAATRRAQREGGAHPAARAPRGAACMRAHITRARGRGRCGILWGERGRCSDDSVRGGGWQLRHRRASCAVSCPGSQKPAPVVGFCASATYSCSGCALTSFCIAFGNIINANSTQ